MSKRLRFAFCDYEHLMKIIRPVHLHHFVQNLVAPFAPDLSSRHYAFRIWVLSSSHIVHLTNVVALA